MPDRPFTILDLIDLDLKEQNALNLHAIAGRLGLSRQISVPEMNHPGLALTGYFDSFAWQRIQIMGRGESAYMNKLEEERNVEVFARFFEQKIPCCIFTTGCLPSKSFIAAAEAGGCAILGTDLPTSDFTTRLTRVLSNIFAPKKKLHGTLVEVYGIGVLIMGESGVGKSETALELIKNGHRLVADDVIEIICVNGNTLIGSGANKIIAHHMEIRGVGIINITHLFGIGAVRARKEVQMVVRLETWDSEKSYDRSGIDEKYEEILGVKIPLFELPVKAGRYTPIIIETAAMNQRLKEMGYDAAKEFNHNVLRWIESDTIRSVYYGRQDII
jgi:HPr kinase/phosphorylase